MGEMDFYFVCKDQFGGIDFFSFIVDGEAVIWSYYFEYIDIVILVFFQLLFLDV